MKEKHNSLARLKMEDFEGVADKNLLGCFKMYAASQGVIFRQRELENEILGKRIDCVHKGVGEPGRVLKKKRKLEGEENKKELEDILKRAQEKEGLELLQNKYLSLRIKSVEPVWHAPWKLMRVISGHQGWVRCLSVDPTNSWFASGSNDRMIKIWDLPTGQLKLSLVGHINAIRGLTISDRHPFLFSCSEDKKIHCWDLEQNKIVRQYHGHLCGVYSIALHPQLDVIISGSRDNVCRVWDIRTKTQVRILEGHSGTVFSLACQANQPQVISGSADCTVKLWDLGTGKSIKTLTKHKKSVRAVKFHNEEYTFVSAGADNLKLWKCPEGEYLRSFVGHEAILNDFDINNENVMVTAADNGSLGFWDYNSGFKYQEIGSRVQPGSLSSEAGIFASCFDRSGLRLLTGECDKTIKVWKEDERATPETHPLPKEAKYFIRTKYD